VLRSRLILPAAALLFLTGGGAELWLRAGQSATPVSIAPLKSALGRYCVTCHNGKLKTAGVELDALLAAPVEKNAETWEKVARKLRTQEMPPPGVPRPDQATYLRTNTLLEEALDSASAAAPKPGRVAVHRLNRVEYVNAVRDLLNVEIEGANLLSADDASQEGFDNIASILSVSPSLLENYLSAARTVSRLAIGDPKTVPAVETFKISKALVQEDRMSEDLPFGSQGGAAIRHRFPLDGEYTIKVLLRREEYDYLIGMGEPHQMDIRLDGVLLKRFSVGGEAKGMTTPESYGGNTQGGPEFELYMHNADAALEVRVPVTAGEHEVGISFLRRFWEPEGILQPPQTGFARSTNEYYHGNPAVEFVYIGGPYGAVSPGTSASRRRILLCTPKDAADEEPCARRILTTLARRAYRRPLTEADVQTVLRFYREGRSGADFDSGLREGVERILAAPSFLFRVERQPAGLAPGSVYAINDLDLASRLSFFLWSSIPDDTLLDLALAGKLHQPAVLEQQVRRMLRDPRSQALVNDFATRWLELNKLSGVVPDTELYPEFDENLRDAMAQETRLFVGNELREDRGIANLLTARYTYLNERLAKHYGIPDVYGSHFRQVTLDDSRRGGLLGQASVLTVTSYPNRTSVAIRGRWLLANLLGSPPPPPPPNIPELKDATADGQAKSLRVRMEIHRQNPACAGCHRRMDPLGFALENFDADGKWRAAADGVPVDASASLPDGTRFDGVAGLRDLLASHQEDFARTITEKLMAYAVGRGVEYTDLPAVRGIARHAGENGYRWSSVIFGIVNSAPFRTAAAGGESPKVARK
jgi:mono/diheme cytochrome c family protein